jgi:uncharacterized protein (TIGR03083 family)
VHYASFVVEVDRLGNRLADAADGSLDAPVPSCPGWTVDDLVRHIAEVYEHKIASTQQQRVPDPWPPAWPADRDPVEWFRDAHGRLLAMFTTHQPTDPSPTWWPDDQTVGFWARRMAHETAIHGADAELAATGAVTPLDASLATDGVDEILRIMLEGDWSEAPSAQSLGQRVAVLTGDRSWIVTLNGLSIGIAEAPADDGVAARISGDPSALDLWLWGRAPDAAITIDGDADEAALLRERLAVATQ